MLYPGLGRLVEGQQPSREARVGVGPGVRGGGGGSGRHEETRLLSASFRWARLDYPGAPDVLAGGEAPAGRGVGDSLAAVQLYVAAVPHGRPLLAEGNGQLARRHHILEVVRGDQRHALLLHHVPQHLQRGQKGQRSKSQRSRRVQRVSKRVGRWNRC